MSAEDQLRSVEDRIVGRLHKVATRSQQTTAKEVAGLNYLTSLLRPVAWIPAAGGWAASYESIATMVDEVVNWSRPKVILEAGSGVSTIWLGLAARLAPSGTRVVSLESDAEYAARTRATLHRHGLLPTCDVIDAPIVGDEGDAWYDTSDVAVQDVGLLLVDGPPGTTRRNARNPAYWKFRPQLTPQALIVIDDIDRADEKAMALDWVERTPQPARLQHLGDFGGAGFYRYEGQSVTQ